MPIYKQRPTTGAHLKSVNPILSRIFAARGLQSDDELDLAVSGLIPPGKMKGIEAAASYLADALATQKRIIIIADYDCDGATACTVGIRGLRMLGFEHVQYLVPNRFVDGYGLTPSIVDQVLALPEKFDILMTVDNGIASVSGVDHANQNGLQVIVTDHHLPGDETPAAAHIINPNQHGCQFPSKSLAGVGVIFYTLLALRTELRNRGRFTRETQPRIDRLLDIVALGTVADVVQLDKNNRILVQNGLNIMRSGRAHAGIQALFDACGKKIAEAKSGDLGFFIGPRINAAGRMDDMTVGIRCLLSDDPTEAGELAKQLNALNNERRSVEGAIQEQAELIIQDLHVESAFTISLTDSSWHQGVIGIVAGRLKEKHHRPTIVFADAGDGQLLKGSGRSIPGVHLRDVLDTVSKRHPDIITKFGGHAMAAGLSIHKDKFSAFCDAFELAVRELITEDDLEQCVFHDGTLAADDFTLSLAESIGNQIWGQGFPEPLFVGAFEVKSSRLIAEKHLKLQLQPVDSNQKSHILDAVWFRNTTAPDPMCKLAFKVQKNEYKGNVTVQLLIEGAIQ